SSSGVGAKLGMDALNTSVLAGAIGFAFIMVFMIVLYRVSGVAADLALMLYVGLVVMILSTMGATLTLPGIAGIILSIGMAVDANVIIFTRIKEELVAGRSVRSSVDAGFSKAFSAILDGNVTTLIAAAVLWTMGTGLIKSFAQTLAVGIVVSMFTALVVTRTILKLFIGMGMTKPTFFASMKAPKERTLAIIANRKKYYFLSATIIIIGLAAMPFFGMQGKDILNYDVEFKGGSVIQVDLKQDVNPESDIMPLIDEHIPNSGARIQKVAGTNEIIITMKAVEEDGRAALTKAISEKYNLTEADLLKDNFVSATISDEFKLKAIGAVALGAVFMLIYITIRFKDFKFGASAVIALLHNVMIMLGVYALFRIPINNSFIAAMLTIVGYSINDTIIIFDRIRENRGRMQGDDEDIINTSIKQTLTRSINTSITTIVMVVLLFVIGTDAVKEFAFPLVIGIVAGTYSSIFIASPLWYQMRKYMREHKPQAKKKPQPKKA
ncbi:MAG: protein translocase subunit SecF, partial [Cellulosilyticaceae bacterium]